MGTEVGAVVIVGSVPIVDVSPELVDGLDKGVGGIDGGGKEGAMFLTCPSWAVVTRLLRWRRAERAQEGVKSSAVSGQWPREGLGFLLVSFFSLSHRNL